MSLSSSSHNSKTKIYTFRGKNNHLHAQRDEDIISGQEREKDSRNHIEFDSEYYVSKRDIRKKMILKTAVVQTS